MRGRNRCAAAPWRFGRRHRGPITRGPVHCASTAKRCSGTSGARVRRETRSEQLDERAALSTAPGPDFFISYTQADREWAEWIASTLERDGYSTVLQSWDFSPDSNFVIEMQKAAASALHTIAVLSPDYLNSDYAD